MSKSLGSEHLDAHARERIRTLAHLLVLSVSRRLHQGGGKASSFGGHRSCLEVSAFACTNENARAHTLVHSLVLYDESSLP